MPRFSSDLLAINLTLKQIQHNRRRVCSQTTSYLLFYDFQTQQTQITLCWTSNKLFIERIPMYWLRSQCCRLRKVLYAVSGFVNRSTGPKLHNLLIGGFHINAEHTECFGSLVSTSDVVLDKPNHTYKYNYWSSKHKNSNVFPYSTIRWKIVHSKGKHSVMPTFHH